MKILKNVLYIALLAMASTSTNIYNQQNSNTIGARIVNNTSSHPTDVNCQQYIVKDGCTTDKPIVNTTINSTVNGSCIFSCTYDPSVKNPVRLSVHFRSSIVSDNVFVLARQNHEISAWTLPIRFKKHIHDPQPFSTIEELLCPPRQEYKEKIYVSITTNSIDNVNIQFELRHFPVQIKKDDKLIIVSSPVSPLYKLYLWEDDEESVLVSVRNMKELFDSVCTLLSIQNGNCPVYTESRGVVAGEGRYQSFTTKAGMVVHKSQFPDGIYILILPLPDDELCTGIAESMMNKTKRSKSVELSILLHQTITDTWWKYVITFLVLSVVYAGFTKAIVQIIARKLQVDDGPSMINNELLVNDEHPLIDSTRMNMLRVIVAYQGGVLPMPSNVAYDGDAVPMLSSDAYGGSAIPMPSSVSHGGGAVLMPSSMAYSDIPMPITSLAHEGDTISTPSISGQQQHQFSNITITADVINSPSVSMIEPITHPDHPDPTSGVLRLRQSLDNTEEVTLIDNGNNDRMVIAQPATHYVINQLHQQTSVLFRNNSLLQLSRDHNPSYFGWWMEVSKYESTQPENQIGQEGLMNNLILMAIFTALPIAELLRSYLDVFYMKGSEDQCIYNTRCLTSLGILPDFSRVFSNISYVQAGIGFLYITNQHRNNTTTIKKCYPAFKNLGVQHNYNLYKCFGLSLIIQAFMSTLYHTCPNRVTIRVDMTYMYVIAIITIMGMWGLRHGDITRHVYPSTCFVGFLLLFAETRQFFGAWVFWGILGLIHLFYTISIIYMLYKFGTWTFNPLNVYKEWRKMKNIMNKLRETISNGDNAQTRPNCWTVIFCMLIFLVNCGFVVFGFIYDPLVYNYILYVCIVHMIIYFIRYLGIKKLKYNEEFGSALWVWIVLAIVCWFIAIVFFLLNNIDIGVTASQSRALNGECIVGGIFDAHDMWHLFSSAALYFTFVVILTMDDSLAFTESTQMPVF